ncbi:MAG: ATP-grasp domain-containing protein [Burkholderiaceae bacterium]
MINPEQKTALLTLGRLPKALDVARALAGAGYRVIVAEPFAWHLCRVSRSVSRSYQTPAPNDGPDRYRQALLDIIEREQVDLVVPVSEEAMHVVLLAPALPARTRLLASRADLVRQLHDKQAFIALARENKLLVPDTTRLGTEQARQLIAREPVVIKPVYSCAGNEIAFLAAGDPLPAADPNRPLLVQKRLDGAHLSTQSLAHRGRLLGSVTYRGTLFSGTVAAGFEQAPNAAVDDWVRTFVDQTQYSGFIAFDFICDERGRPHAIECNPRLTSGIHFMEPSSLASAMLNPASASEILLRPATKLHQFYTTLTESQSAMFRPAKFKPYLDMMRSHRDVTWDKNDPWPFLLMTPLSWPILSRAILRGISLGEAATQDIARLSAKH